MTPCRRPSPARRRSRGRIEHLAHGRLRVGPIIGRDAHLIQRRPDTLRLRKPLRRLHRHSPPIEFSFFGRVVHRLSGRRNRKLNHRAHGRRHPDPSRSQPRPGATTTARSSKATRHEKRFATSSAGSTTSRGGTSSPTPADVLAGLRRGRGRSRRRCDGRWRRARGLSTDRRGARHVDRAVPLPRCRWRRGRRRGEGRVRGCHLGTPHVRASRRSCGERGHGFRYRLPSRQHRVRLHAGRWCVRRPDPFFDQATPGEHP